MATLRRGLAAVPGDPGLGVPLAEEYERARRYDEAMRTYEELLKVNAGLIAARNNLASLLLDHRTDTASFRRALELATPFAESRNPLLLDTLGWAHYRNGDHGQAVHELERAVAASANVPALRYHLGMAYLAANNPVGARQELGKALSEPKADFPGIAEARQALAKLEKNGGAARN